MEVSSVNKVILVGRLGNDPEVKHTNSNIAVAELSIATSEKYKTQNGSFNEKTEWHKCIVWRQTAEFANKYLKKGQLVYIEGKLQTQKWEDKTGSTQYTTKIQVSSLTALSSGQKNIQENKNNPSSNDKNNENDDDIIPF